MDLESILVAYLGEHADWLDYLSASQSDRLHRVAATAQKLKLALLEVEAVDATWATEQSITPNDRSRLMEYLERLAAMRAESPHRHNSGLEYRAATNLQLRLDKWWKDTAGTSIAVKEEVETPFHQFVRLVLSALPEETRLGESSAAIKVRRSEGKTPGKKVKKALEAQISALAEKLSTLKR